LPDTTPGVHFDVEGVCSRCREHRPIAYRGEAALIEVLASFHNPANPYDCCVAVSGGRDSMYALLKVVKDYGLRALAVNYENPYTHPHAKKNMENAVRLLGVDFVSVKPKEGTFERCFRNNLSAWLRRPSIAMIPMLCVQCRTMDWDICRAARRNGVRCIVTGASAIQDAPFVSQLSHVSATVPFEASIVKAGPRVLLAMARNPRYLNPLCLSVLAKSYLVAMIKAIGPGRLGLGVTKLGVFSFLKWDEQEVTSRVTAELGWDYPRDTDQMQRFDCPIAHLKNYIYRSALGVSKIDEYYANMVREGSLSRDEAMRRLEQDSRFDDEPLLDAIERTGNDGRMLLPRLKDATAVLNRQTPEGLGSA
jgi:hypothetical protein